MRYSTSFVAALSLLLIAACSVQADDGSWSPPSVDLSGPWSGSWHSQTTGHRGPLKARFTQKDDKTIRAQFRGRFFVVIPFRYAVDLEVIDATPDHLNLSGSSRLGPVFGTFYYSATITGQEFSADFRSRRDAGQFKLLKMR